MPGPLALIGTADLAGLLRGKTVFLNRADPVERSEIAQNGWQVARLMHDARDNRRGPVNIEHENVGKATQRPEAEPVGGKVQAKAC